MVRMAEAIANNSEQLLGLTELVMKIKRQSPDSGLGLKNIVRDGLLALLTGYVVADIAMRVIS